MGHVIRALVLLGSLALPAAAHGSASARMSVSVRVVPSVVVSPQVVRAASAAIAASGARDAVVDASGAPVPVVVRWQERPDGDAGASWVTVLPDGGPLPATSGGSGLPGR